MQADETNPQEGILLFCLQGRPAPQQVIEGWKRYLSFPRPVQDDLWELVASALSEPESPQNQARLEAFCNEHKLSREEATPAVQACGFLLGRVCSGDLAADSLRQDLNSLSAGHPQAQSAADAIMPRFEEIKSTLRQKIVLSSLSDHGKVLEGLDWRVDSVSSSSRGVQLNAGVVFLTLRYREAGEPGRVTLQVTPEGLNDLKAFMERFQG